MIQDKEGIPSQLIINIKLEGVDKGLYIIERSKVYREIISEMVYNIYKQINIGDINEYNFILNEKNINKRIF